MQGGASSQGLGYIFVAETQIVLLQDRQGSEAVTASKVRHVADVNSADKFK